MGKIMRGIRAPLFLVCFAILWSGYAPAFAKLVKLSDTTENPRRVALVIGNGDYQYTPKLKNPRNDAEDVGAALKRLGFDVVVALDVDQNGFQAALREFDRRSSEAKVALFFFSGQGLQVDGQNLLAPVDAKLESAADVQREMIAFDQVMQTLERAPGVKIAIVDACRDNAFHREFGTTRSAVAQRGLARLDANIDTLVIMSTSPGSVAFDGEGRNSPFTEALLTNLETPGLEVNLLMRRVMTDVLERTAGRQTPWISSALTTDFYFNGSAPAGQKPQQALVANAALVDQEAEKSWGIIGADNDPEKLISFVKSFPASKRLPEAMDRISALLIEKNKRKVLAQGGPQKRVALVIGNGKYVHAKILINPANDAKRVAEALKRLGFEVRSEFDVDMVGFQKIMPEFSDTATDADIALVYYSGHAIELGDAAYIMPVDSAPISRSHIRNQLKSVHDIISDLDTASGLKLVVVDGCRDNPLAAKLFGILGIPRGGLGETRGGLALPELEERKVGDLIVAFATLHGESAYDGTEANSPFTSSFLQHVEEKDMDVDHLFRLVTQDVLKATKDMQRPEIINRRTDREFLLRAALLQPKSSAAAK